MSNSRAIYIDYLKLFSAAMIIFLHVSAVFIFLEVTPMKAPVPLLYFFNYLTRMALQIFMMCSGMLLLRPHYHFDFKKKCLLIVRLYFFWSAVYLGVKILLCNLSHSPLTPQEMVLHFFLGPYHFWYLVVLLGFYLLMPVLKHCKDFATLSYLVAGILFLVFINPLLQGFAPEQTKIIFNEIALVQPQLLLFYFILGAWLERLPKRWYFFALSLLGISVGGYLQFVHFTADASYSTIIAGGTNYTLSILLIVSSVFYIFKYLCHGRTAPAWVFSLSKQILYIYILSPLFIFAFELGYKARLIPFVSHSVFISTVFSIVIFFLSYIAALVVTAVKKYVAQRFHALREKQKGHLHE